MNQILTDEELITIADDEQFWDNHFGYQECDAYALARAIEQAILNKLSDQKPIAYMLRNDVDGVDLSDEAFSWDKDVTAGHTVAVYIHPAPSVPEGYVMAPVEPTLDQIVDGQDAGSIENSKRIIRIYKAMLSAARMGNEVPLC